MQLEDPLMRLHAMSEEEILSKMIELENSIENWEATYHREKRSLYENLKIETSKTHRTKILDEFFSKLEAEEMAIKSLDFYKLFRQKIISSTS